MVKTETFWPGKTLTEITRLENFSFLIIFRHWAWTKTFLSFVRTAFYVSSRTFWEFFDIILVLELFAEFEGRSLGLLLKKFRQRCQYWSLRAHRNILRMQIFHVNKSFQYFLGFSTTFWWKFRTQFPTALSKLLSTCPVEHIENRNFTSKFWNCSFSALWALTYRIL